MVIAEVREGPLSSPMILPVRPLPVVFMKTGTPAGVSTRAGDTSIFEPKMVIFPLVNGGSLAKIAVAIRHIATVYQKRKSPPIKDPVTEESNLASVSTESVLLIYMVLTEESVITRKAITTQVNLRFVTTAGQAF